MVNVHRAAHLQQKSEQAKRHPCLAKDCELQLVSREWGGEKNLRGQHSVDAQLVPNSGWVDLHQYSAARVQGFISYGFPKKLGVPPPSRYENACWFREGLLHARRRLEGQRKLVTRAWRY